MPVTFQKYTLNAPNVYDVATTNWIDISTAKRVRIVIPKLPEVNGITPDYRAWISHGTFDPAQNTAVIEYDETYMCGWGADGNIAKFYPQSDLFDRNNQELGVNRIKLSYTNLREAPTLDVFLILES